MNQKMDVEAKHSETTHVEVLKAQPFDDKVQSGDVHLVAQNGHIQRIPVPSSDPNDPLNMPRWQKMGVVVCCCWFSIFSLVLVGGLGPILGSFFKEYLPLGYNTQQVVNLTTYPSLVMAFGSFLILPLSMMFGRRPVFLGCSILLLGSTIGAATSKTYETHMASRILQGIAAGSTESVLPLIISDITFLDQRGGYFAVYWGTQNLINTVFGISCSYLVAASSWRYFYWVLAIFAAVGLVMSVFLLPETRYNRSATSMNGQIVHTDEWGITHILSTEEAEQRGVIADVSVDVNTKRASYAQRLKPWSAKADNALKLGLSCNVKMIQSCSSPGVIWAILVASISLGTGIAMSLVYSTILTTGFHWSEKSIGLVNAGIFPASLFAMFYAGFLGDKMNIWLAKRRGGVHIPEDSLIQLIFPFFMGVIGIVIFGVTARWPESYSSWGIVMGWTLYEFSFIVMLIVTTHFGSEAFPQNPGPALVMVVGVKNIVSFAASYGIVPMVHMYNYLEAFMILLAFFGGIFMLGIPIYFWNPKWRKWAARRKEVVL